MILDGKEIHVLSGAIIVFQHIPLSLTLKRDINESEYDCLENLCDRIMTLAENEYKKIGAEDLGYIDPENPTDNDTIRKRLSINMDIPFSETESRLVTESLDAYITEAEARKDGKSMNVYYSGDMYGLDTEDFRKLSERIRAEIRDRRDRKSDPGLCLSQR